MDTLPQDYNEVMADVAQEYTDNGWSCYPLSIDSKRPLAKWKRFQTEVPSYEEIEDWRVNGAPKTDADTGEEYGRDKFFNLALVTGAISGFVVVDCDTPHAVQFAKDNHLTSPISVRTSRGCHYYFKHPNNGRRYQNKVGTRPAGTWYDCPGLDFRGDGGYVVAPPSLNINPDLTIKHEYSWDVSGGLDFIEDMPVWSGDADDLDVSEGFDLATLSLENIPLGNSMKDVRDQVRERTEFLDRKLVGPDCGDATDDWMIRYAGQMVRRGLDGQELWDNLVEFHSEFFDYNGTPTALERWLKTKMRSAMDMDRRSHPEDYDPQTKERIKEDKTEEKSDKSDVTLKPIYSQDFQRILDGLGDVEYHVDPIIPSRSIIQVVGYNGHGKSFFTGSMITALASNRPQFGPYFINKPVKCIYLDFDNPARTVLNRFSNFMEQHADPANNLAIWSPAIIPSEQGGQMNLREADGLATLESWLELVKPDVVVVDTVRNAFGGMDENSPQDWYHVNRVSKIIRDKYNATVILVHHRNKPGESGLGREAGSTAQLTDLDTQIIITQVYQDKDIAKTKAGLCDEDCSFTRNNNVYTPFHYFDEKFKHAQTHDSTRIRMITQVSFGKVREETDLHNTTYICWSENIDTGEPSVVWLPSPREDAVHKYAGGLSPNEISRQLYIPLDTINKWLGI